MLPPPSFARSGATKQSSFLVAAQEAGLLRFARNDGGSISARSRDSFSPGSCQFVVPLLPRGRRESRAPTAPAAWGQRKTSPPDSHHEFSQSHRLSPRNGFTVCFVLSPVSGVDCHRCLRDTSRKIDATVAAPGPHDFAVRCLRFARRYSRLTPQRPSHPGPTYRDDHDASLWAGRGERTSASDLPDEARRTL